jgi:demethylmenaquinone methyltransferase/2-methoxy-6-polyprenyl-1,4-benzoquinol methylase
MRKDPYRLIARFYDAFVEPITTTIRQIGLKMYTPVKGALILDIGCGTGTNLNLYQMAGCKVWGIDSSPAMIDIAREKLGKRAELRIGDASQMPYPDDQFDLVAVMLSLHEMPSQIRSDVMSEIFRVMKDDGRVLLIDYHTGPILFPKGWYYKIIILLFEIAAGIEHYRNYRDFLEKDGLPSLYKSQGLILDKKKIISGGNLGLFLLRQG